MPRDDRFKYFVPTSRCDIIACVLCFAQFFEVSLAETPGPRERGKCFVCFFQEKTTTTKTE